MESALALEVDVQGQRRYSDSNTYPRLAPAAPPARAAGRARPVKSTSPESTVSVILLALGTKSQGVLALQCK